MLPFQILKKKVMPISKTSLHFIPTSFIWELLNAYIEFLSGSSTSGNTYKPWKILITTISETFAYVQINSSLHSLFVMRNRGFCTTHSRWLVHCPLVFSCFVHSFPEETSLEKCSGLSVERHEKTACSQRGVSVRCSWGAARLSSQIGRAMVKDLQFWEKVISASC